VSTEATEEVTGIISKPQTEADRVSTAAADYVRQRAFEFCPAYGPSVMTAILDIADELAEQEHLRDGWTGGTR
jgi:hypothetical protein